MVDYTKIYELKRARDLLEKYNILTIEQDNLINLKIQEVQNE